MGCDIHSLAEVKERRFETAHHESGLIAGKFVPGSERWVAIDDEIFPNTYYDANSKYEPFTKRGRKTPLDDRNYDLFALLADVRNGYGFAGTPRGNRIEPLSEPRGVPDDASFTWLETVDSWSVDMHSHSWFTLAELVAWQEAGRLKPHMVRTGVIPASVYEQLKRDGGEPQGWSGSVSGVGIWTLTPEQWDAGERPVGIDPVSAQYIDGWRAKPDWDEASMQERFNNPTYYIQYTWESSLEHSVGELEAAIDALRRYAADRPPAWRVEAEGIEDKPGWMRGDGKEIPYENIRIVFGFDN
jgi:hypothetical protein